jgi:hypothetical protein
MGDAFLNRIGPGGYPGGEFFYLVSKVDDFLKETILTLLHLGYLV